MVGRTEEIKILNDLLHSKEAELVAVLGRRRVGKTYLVREAYRDNLVFEFVGIQNGTTQEQLNSFVFGLKQAFGKESVPNLISNWLDAFEQLIDLLSARNTPQKRVIFIDELPWIANRKSDFLKAFGFFWNSWGSKNNLIVVICGSAASWMIRHVIQNTGGLHNRVTRQIYLQPFTCIETKLFLEERGIKFNEQQITELYMVLGGIPYYLKLVKKGKSVAQVIDDLCFGTKSPLKNEFSNLYAALFSNHASHVAVIKACYSKWKGLNQTEIVQLSGLKSGGTLTLILDELETSGFLMATLPFTNVKKEKTYRLTDEFSVFYLKFMESKTDENWTLISQSQAFKSWQGYAFENFCFKHIDKIKQKLGISGIISRQFSYTIKPSQQYEGSQLDLIIDRNDQCINLCEVKYHDAPLVISKQYAEKLTRRIEHFRWHTATKKTVFLTFITKSGIASVKSEGHLIDNEVVLSDFYRQT